MMTDEQLLELLASVAKSDEPEIAEFVAECQWEYFSAKGPGDFRKAHPVTMAQLTEYYHGTAGPDVCAHVDDCRYCRGLATKLAAPEAGQSLPDSVIVGLRSLVGQICSGLEDAAARLIGFSVPDATAGLAHAASRMVTIVADLDSVAGGMVSVEALNPGEAWVSTAFELPARLHLAIVDRERLQCLGLAFEPAGPWRPTLQFERGHSRVRVFINPDVLTVPDNWQLMLLGDEGDEA